MTKHKYQCEFRDNLLVDVGVSLECTYIYTHFFLEEKHFMNIPTYLQDIFTTYINTHAYFPGILLPISTYIHIYKVFATYLNTYTNWQGIFATYIYSILGGIFFAIYTHLTVNFMLYIYTHTW